MVDLGVRGGGGEREPGVEHEEGELVAELVEDRQQRGRGVAVERETGDLGGVEVPHQIDVGVAADEVDQVGFIEGVREGIVQIEGLGVVVEPPDQQRLVAQL